MWSLSWRWRIPKKSDDQGWRNLTETVAKNAASRQSHDSYLKETLQTLERKLADTQKIKNDAKRCREIRMLQNRIQRTKHARTLIQNEVKQAKTPKI
jgi:adenosyl cobinamide kinase/adenosyl cobinamide phosphate guanylyltransferase